MATLRFRTLILVALVLGSQVALAQQPTQKTAADTSHSVKLTTQDLDATWGKLVRQAGPMDTRKAQVMATKTQECLFGKPGQATTKGCLPVGRAVVVDQNDAARARKLMRKLGLPGQDRATKP